MGRRASAEYKPVTSATPATNSGRFKLIMTIGPLPDAGLTQWNRVSWRQNALDLGFHAVLAGPAHPDRAAGGAGMT
jgi:hypothetical protein